jgi:hypothetical protein
MRCTVEKSIDIVAEVDVDLDDVIDELFSRIAECQEDDRPKKWRPVLHVVDAATRLLKAIPDEAIANFPADAVTEARKRLQAEFDRYDRQASGEAKSGKTSDQ